MKIYFCGSIRGGRCDAELYGRIIEQLQAYGPVLTEHVGFKDPILKDIEGDDVAIHTQDMAWLEESDVVVAEVTQPSLGVGYEIGRAVAWKKRILCLYRPTEGKGKFVSHDPRGS
ncbi:DNPH1 [Branchiostoma lanceolatum]|uniref:Putative 2'-deoxynucleoside 5'-phosphate N-hydrolase 1 n=1 Tax=Branchiostoma lanceolatum TaxID=7740 RepID=A0A8K0ENX1_BRALA|nr:DNPH1 [Branchiostoma lanceolatum]